MSFSLNIDSSCKNIIGNFRSDIEYLKAVKTLINCTQETHNRISFINSHIIPSIKNDTVLDIGIGNGEVSNILCKYFKNIHLIDPSRNALNSLNLAHFEDKLIEKIESPVEDFIPPKNYYDLIVNSHTLYYIKREFWKHIIQKSFNALKKGGCLLIVLNNGLGRTKLSRDFGAQDVLKIEQLIEECSTIEGAELEMRTTHEVFRPLSLEDALEVVGICFYDIGIQSEKKYLVKCLEQYYKEKNKENYSIDFLQYFFILRKV